MKEQSTTRGFAVLSAAGMVVKLLSLFYLPFLTRIIGQENISAYSFTYAIFTFMYVLTNSGIPVAISKLVSELLAKHNYRDAVKAFKMARFMLLVMGGTMSIIMIMLAKPLTINSEHQKAYLAIIVLSPTVLITSVMSAYRGYFQGRGNMNPTAVSQVGEQVINTIMSLIFAGVFIKISVEGGVAGGTVGTTIGAFAACVYLILKYEKNKKFKVPIMADVHEVTRIPNKALFRRLIKYGIPITLSVGLQSAGNLVDSFFMKPRLMTGGFSDIIADKKFATIAQLNSLIGVPLTLISALSAAVLPAISAAVAVNDKKRVQDKINQALRLCFMVSIPAAVGLAVLSKPIFSVLFPEAINGANLMKLASLVVVLMSLVQIQTTILQSIGKLYIVTSSMALGIVLKVITSYTLVAVTSINTFGAVIGNIVCFGVPLIINSLYIKKTTKFKLNLVKYSIKPLIASSFMGLIVYLVYFTLETFMIKGNYMVQYIIPMILSMAVGIFVYAYGLILSGGITEKDLDSLSPRITRIIPNFMKERMR